MTTTIPIGLYVLFLILLMPAYITLAAWLFAGPRDARTTGIGIAYMLAILVILIVGTAAMGVGFWAISAI